MCLATCLAPLINSISATPQFSACLLEVSLGRSRFKASPSEGGEIQREKLDKADELPVWRRWRE